WLRYSIT
ncbi:tRNA threonylcarbamoyladenosine biosynthesis protein TsaB, partial [Haemophilus influenzae]